MTTPPSNVNPSNGSEGKPRHLDPYTAQMPAIPTTAKHARPDTAELRAQPQRPPVPPSAPRAERREEMRAREAARNPVKRPWWKFWAAP